MRKAVSIAVNTFRESIRQRLLYVIGLFAAVAALSTFVLSPLSVGAAGGKIITDVGLAAISLLGVLMAVMVGSSLVQKEIDKKAIYMVMTRPVPRHQYLLGKFGGVVMALGLVMTAMAAVMTVMVLAGRGVPGPAELLAIYLSILEMAVMAAIVLFFSTFTTPVLTTFFSVCVFVAGSLSGDLRAFAGKFGGAAVKMVMDVFYYVLPNMKVFDLRNEAVHGLRYSSSDIVLATVYAVVYCGALIYLAWMVFRRRQFS